MEQTKARIGKTPPKADYQESHALNLDESADSGYLGSSRVVARVVRDFYGRVLQANAQEDLHAACAWAAEVFMGLDSAYAPVDGGAGLAAAMRTRLGVKRRQWVGDTLKQGFAVLATEAFGIVRSHGAEGPGQAEIDKLILFTEDLLLGVADVIFPPGLSWRTPLAAPPM